MTLLCLVVVEGGGGGLPSPPQLLTSRNMWSFPPFLRLTLPHPFPNSLFWNAERHNKLSWCWSEAKDITLCHITLLLRREVRMCLQPLCLLPTCSRRPLAKWLVWLCVMHYDKLLIRVVVWLKSMLIEREKRGWKDGWASPWTMLVRTKLGHDKSLTFTPKHAIPSFFGPIKDGPKVQKVYCPCNLKILDSILKEFNNWENLFQVFSKFFLSLFHFNLLEFTFYAVSQTTNG